MNTTMTIEQRSNIIKKIVEAFPEPLQNLCPEASIGFRRKDGFYVKNLRNGEERYFSDDIGSAPRCGWDVNSIKRVYYGYNNSLDARNQILASPTKDIFATYTTIYHLDDEEILEISAIHMNGNRRGECPRKWKYYVPTQAYQVWTYAQSRTFLFKSCKVPFNQKGEPLYPESQGKNYNQEYIRCLKYGVCQRADMNYVRRTFAEFTDNYNSKWHWGAPNETALYEFLEWYKRYQPLVKPKKITQEQIIINNLEELPNFHLEASNSSNSYRYNRQTKIHFEMVEDHGVFRVCTIEQSGSSEDYRVLITPKGKVQIWERRFSGWTRTTLQIKSVFGWGSQPPEYIGLDNIGECTPLKYLKPIIEGKEGRDVLITLVDALRHPVIEQLSKAGLPHIANYMTVDGYVKRNLKYAFGVDEKKLALTKLLSMNMYQLRKIDKLIDTQGDYTERLVYYQYARPLALRDLAFVIRTFRALSGVENVSSLSNDATDKIWEATIKLYKVGYTVNHLILRQDENGLYRRTMNYGWARADAPIEITEEERRRAVKVLTKYSLEDIRAYIDTLKIYMYLDNPPRFNIYDQLSDSAAINRLHEEMVNLNREEQRTRNATRMEKEMEETKVAYGKHLEKYSKIYGKENDEFIIIPPKNPMDFVTEGEELRHCVNGYRSQYVAGSTIILFLRKKENVDKPFYTIEVKNDRLIQIHGYCNRWLGNNPEAILFVKEWLEERMISYEKNILLSLSQNYGIGQDFLDGRDYGFDN